MKEYFPATLVNADAKRYELAKIAYGNGSYTNDTDPVTQSHGDFYSAETAWVKKRIMYIMSKYNYGLFSANGTDTIIVRAAGDLIDYDITPAFDMYPAIANGTSIVQGARTKAGAVCRVTIDLGGSADQQNAIQAASWLLGIGDWHRKNVSGTMVVRGKRLTELVLGSKTDTVIISITGLTISNCGSMQKILLSNISTLQGTLDLSACWNMREIYADGTSLTQIKLPEGGGLELIEYPSANKYLTLRNFPVLEAGGVIIDGCKAVITDFFVTDCPKLDPIDLLVQVMNAQLTQPVHELKRVRAVGFNATYSVGGGAILDLLGRLADGTYAGLNSEGLAGEDEYPVLDGTLSINANCYEDTVMALRAVFSKLTLNITGSWYIRFADNAVKNICATNWGDGTGITREQAAAVTTLGDKFRGNSNITSFDEFELFTGVTVIDTNLFYGTANLESIVLPEFAKTINAQAFYLCSSLSTCSGISNIASIGSYAFQKCALDGTLDISNCKMLEAGAFYFCQQLEKVILSDNIVQIKNDTFRDCINLESINIPANTTTIGRFSFSNCRRLETVDLSNVSEIQESAFSGCSSLVSLGEIKNIKTLGNNVFNGCTSIQGMLDFSNCTTMGTYVFERCNRITHLMLSDELGTIPRILIRNCTALESINIPSKVTLIGEQAFSGCTGLNCPIILPNTLVQIDGLAFSNCVSVPYINILAIIPPTLGFAVFSNTNCPIYVPVSSVNAYKSADGWKDYASRIQAIVD